MKRRFTRFIQWASKEHECIIALLIGVIVGVTSFMCYFMPTDIVPATEQDYEPLEKLIYAIQQNPDLLLKTKHNIDATNGDIVTIDISNDECGLKVEYDQDLKILSSSRYDKYTFWGEALLAALVIGAWMSLVTMFVALMGICLIEEIYKNFKFAKSQKTIRVSKNDGAV